MDAYGIRKRPELSWRDGIIMDLRSKGIQDDLWRDKNVGWKISE